MIEAPLLPFDIASEAHMTAWTRAVRHFAPAMKFLDGTHEMIDLLTMTAHGVLHLWPGDHASCLTEIDVFPRKKVCNVFLVGGIGGLQEVQDWTAAGGPLEMWAFGAMGCDWITTTGREGLSRTMGRMEKRGTFFVRKRDG